jgi:Coenzyme PQQ synthesis protein D (PqqD)
MTAPLVKCPEAYSETAIDGEIVLLSLARGTFYSLTGTAAAIWPLIDGTRSRNAMLEQLAEDHAAAPEAIAADLDAFLAQLTEAGFVAGG